MTKINFYKEFSLTSELKRQSIEFECLNDAYTNDTIPCLQFIKDNLDREYNELLKEKRKVFIIYNNSWKVKYIHLKI